MKFLVDNALSPLIAEGLKAAGYDAVHVRDYGLARSADEIILRRAADEGRTVVTADTDFPTLLAIGRLASPSVVLLRRPRTTAKRLRILIASLPDVHDSIDQGSVVTFDQDQVRVRSLPIGDS